MNRFVDSDELDRKSEKAKQQLQAYFCKVFALEYMDRDEITKLVDPNSLQNLSEELAKRNPLKREELASNDALMVLAVYAQRRLGKEIAKYDGFGLRTWWLTKETRVLSYTMEIVRGNGGVPYIMRPEFLLNFLNFAPLPVNGEQLARDLLPSHVGLQIGQHLPSDHMHRILEGFDEWKDLPPERIEIKMSDAVDQLKFNRMKQYENNLNLDSEEETNQLLSYIRNSPN